MQVVRKSSCTASPWKNGGGITHEVIRIPADAAQFRWRVSVAQIDASGPFSDFPGYHRAMVLLRGGGLRLTFQSHGHEDLSVVGALAEFDGGTATDCRLMNGPCTDLNLIVSKTVRSRRVWVQQLAGPQPLPIIPEVPQTLLVFPIDGPVSIAGSSENDLSLDAWDLALAAAPDCLSVISPMPGSIPRLVFFAALADT